MIFSRTEAAPYLTWTPQYTKWHRGGGQQMTVGWMNIFYKEEGPVRDNEQRVLSVLSPQSAINIQLAPNSLAAPTISCLSSFTTKPTSFFNQCSCHCLNPLSFVLFFSPCPEMPEGSSYLAQNSTDLSAAISPGSLYLISFCKILSHLLLVLLSRFLSLLACRWLCFFPQRIWFPLFFLVWTLPGCFFLSPRQSVVHGTQPGEFARCGRLCFGDFPSVGEPT